MLQMNNAHTATEAAIGEVHQSNDSFQKRLGADIIEARESVGPYIRT